MYLYYYKFVLKNSTNLLQKFNNDRLALKIVPNAQGTQGLQSPQLGLTIGQILSEIGQEMCLPSVKWGTQKFRELKTARPMLGLRKRGRAQQGTWSDP